jgi:hypothetical protein
MDRAKGNKASGWYRDFKVAPSSNDPSQFSLYAQVELTDEAKRELADNQWKYFSLEWDDLYKDSSTGNEFQDVITGGGFTNRPIAKKTMPINFSEMVSDEVKEAYEVLTKEGFTITAESKEWEHSEPGTGSPPEPRLDDESGMDDPAIESGSRRDSPPIVKELEANNKGGDSVLTKEQIDELYKIAGVDPPAETDEEADHSELVTAISTKFSETASKELTPEEKRFSEDYPVQWAEMQRLTGESREREGKQFSESVATVKRPDGDKLVKTGHGLSALAMESVAETHRKFAEGNGTVSDFEDAIHAIVDGGIVEFGETGSNHQPEPMKLNTTTAEGVSQARKLFAEKITEIQLEGDGMSFNEALNEAAKRYPELADAYRASAPA